MESFSINGFLQAQYKYDALGRQAVRTLTSPTPVTIHSVFDSDGRRIAEYNETSGALIREYVWNGWEPVAVIEGGTVSYIRADHIGRPVFATNASGAKVWTATYLPFGGVHTSTGALPTARFPGQWFQSESGLHQNWMRDYDPTTGRYLQADPLGLIDGASVYGYALQNPERFIDPTGQFVPQAVAGCAMNPVCRGAAVGVGLFIYRKLLLKAVGYCGELLWEEFWTWYNEGDDGDDGFGGIPDVSPHPDGDVQGGTKKQGIKSGGAEQAEEDFDEITGGNPGRLEEVKDAVLDRMVRTWYINLRVAAGRPRRKVVSQLST